MPETNISITRIIPAAWNRIDLTGQRFGRLVVLSYVGTRGKIPLWLCRCDCGKEKVISRTGLRTKTRSCGCLHKEMIRKPRRKYECKLSLRDAVRNQMKCSTRSSARHRGIPWSLDEETLETVLFSNCFYCGKPPSIRRKFRKNGEIFISGIDRLDSNDGYVQGNCVSCCIECNHAKWTMSRNDFVLWVVRIANHMIECGLISMAD